MPGFMWAIKMYTCLGLVSLGLQYLLYRRLRERQLQRRKDKKLVKCEKPVKTEQAPLNLKFIFFHGVFTKCSQIACNVTDNKLLRCTEEKVRRLLKYIDEAQESVDLCCYRFSSNDLLKSLLEANKRGVRIRAYFESGSIKEGSMAETLKKEGILVKSRLKKEDDSIMHLKLIIIDEKIVFDGSMNWTNHALHSNAENVMVIFEERFVKQYVEFFEKNWSEN